MDDNLRAGRIKLMFVADTIPAELARIVEFLNDQMRADVRAVELNYYQGPDGSRLLAPKVIGDTERSRAQKEGARPRLEPISVEDWLVKHVAPRGPHVLEGAQVLVSVMRKLGSNVAVASTQGSIYCSVTGPTGKNSYPFFVTRGGTGQVGFGWLNGSPFLADEAIRQGFYDRFANAIGPLNGRNITRGFPSFPLERLRDPERLHQFRAVAEDFVNACTTSSEATTQSAGIGTE